MRSARNEGAPVHVMLFTGQICQHIVKGRFQVYMPHAVYDAEISRTLDVFIDDE